MRCCVRKSPTVGEPVTIGEGAAVAGIITTLAYAFRWLVGLEGRLNAHEVACNERMRRLDERHLEILKRSDELRTEIVRVLGDIRSEIRAQRHHREG